MFDSCLTGLVPNDTNGQEDIIVRDRLAGTTTRISVDEHGGESLGQSQRPYITRNGRFVSFCSRGQLVASDTDNFFDAYLRDLQSGTITRISVTSGGGPPDGSSFDPVVSEDGRFVAFTSTAQDIVLPDTTTAPEVFVRDLVAQKTFRISAAPDGTSSNGQTTNPPSVTSDGRVVVFESDATNLVSNDTSTFDIYVAPNAN